MVVCCAWHWRQPNITSTIRIRIFLYVFYTGARRKFTNVGKFRFGFRKCISIKLGTYSLCVLSKTKKKKEAGKRRTKLYFAKKWHPIMCDMRFRVAHAIRIHTAIWWVGLRCHNGTATWPTAATQCFRFDLNRVQIKLKPKRKTFSLNENGKNLPVVCCEFGGEIGVSGRRWWQQQQRLLRTWFWAFEQSSFFRFSRSFFFFDLIRLSCEMISDGDRMVFYTRGKHVKLFAYELIRTGTDTRWDSDWKQKMERGDREMR